MPYITQESREAIDLEDLDHGDLTYAICVAMDQYVKRHGMSYTVLSQARSAALDAADEFYRRVMAPYEDEKCEQNGDVFTCLPAKRHE